MCDLLCVGHCIVYMECSPDKVPPAVAAMLTLQHRKVSSSIRAARQGSQTREKRQRTVAGWVTRPS